MTNPYFDKRQEFFRSYFEKALGYKDYIATGEPAHQGRWHAAEGLDLSTKQTELLGSWTRKMNLLCMSGTWCGDCIRQGPMLYKLAQAAKIIDLRFIDNRNNPELQAELKINGADKVPVVVVLSEDFYEIARFGDRHLSVYKRKLKAELGNSCDPGLIRPPEEELNEELGEWIGFLERAQILLRLSPMLRRRYGD